MKSDKEVNEQVDEKNQTQEGGAKKGTSNTKNYTSRCTGLGLHKMFAALSEKEKGVLRATCFAPLLLIDPIATMSTLVVEIFECHLGDMKFKFGETIVQMKPFHVCLILRLHVSPIANKFLFVDPEHMTNFKMRRFPKKKNTYGMKEIDDALKQVKLERHQGDSTLPLGDTPFLRKYQFSTPEKTTKHKRKGGNEKEDRKRKKAEPRTMAKRLTKNQKIEKKKKGKGEWQKKLNANKKNMKAEEVDVPLMKKVKGTKKKTFTDEQFDHVPLIQLKTLIPKIPKKGLANRVPRKRRAEFPELENIQSTAKNLLQQVTPGEGLEVVKDLMVDDDAETMVVAEVAKTDIVFFNQEEVVGEAYQASSDKTTAISVKVQTLEVKIIEDEASQASTDQTTVVSVEKQTIEVAQTDVVFFHQKEDDGEASQSKESKEEVEHNKEEVVEG
ncbi:hypothetical protein GIB67_010977 [Kingdonia uniflora]|uniref:Uncharacterized protein n=1 Tax=Kingdonia uniflora TaxID=39325 RepID=A0A7J7MMD3_9MAGN|nr:hypothetical protein GIB67_010977 [Kingdonia uniflora]